MNQIRPCPACEHTGASRSLQIPEQMFGMPEVFTYLECDHCGSLFIETVPESMDRYYDASAYYSFDEDPVAVMGRAGVRQVVKAVGRAVFFGPRRAVAMAASAVPSREFRTLVAMLSSVRLAGLPHGLKSSVLDVGAGSGSLVFALDLVGLSAVTGIDPFAEADRRVGSHGQLFRRDLSEMEGGAWDLVMLHHSLEHVPSPRVTLRESRDRLAPGGRILVRTPTISSAAYERYGTSWCGCDAPRHMTLFTRRAMDLMCADLGLRVESVLDDSNEAQFWASEQIEQGVPLVSEHSYFVNRGASSFTGSQIRAWRREAARLNRQSRGDQAAWVLSVED